MNKQHYFFILLCCSLTVTSCAKTFDTSSEEALETSAELLKQDLSKQETEKLENAMSVLLIRAMKEKWLDQHQDKSFDSIVKIYIHNKNYNQVVSMAENFLKSHKKEELKKNKVELDELRKKYQLAQNDLTVLDAIKIKSAKIVKGAWSPTIQIEVENKSGLTLIGKSQITYKIDSISHQKTVETATYIYDFEKPIKPNELLTSADISLESLMERSKRLNAKLANPTYPITNLSEYDLKVTLQAMKVTSADGTEYHYDSELMDTHSEKTKELKEAQSQIEKWPVTLTAKSIDLTTDTMHKSDKKFNQKYLADLQRVRHAQQNKKIGTQSLKLPGGVTATLSDIYTVKNERFRGSYNFSLSPTLEFNNQDSRLHQFQIQDNQYVEYRDSNEKSEGMINVLHNPQANFDIKDSIDRQVNRLTSDVIDFDETGYIYRKFDDCELFRYIEHNGYHYAYTMDFPSLDECIVEFDRSREMFITHRQR